MAASRISASSSQLSQRSAATSAASPASRHSAAAGAAGRRPNSRASAAVVDTSTPQPARPPLIQSSVATADDTWKGSVWVVVTVGTSPIRRVSGATRESTASASGPGRAKESRRVTKSSAPRSARRARPV